MAMPKKPIIAVLYDFDKTLSTKDMQEYSFIPNLGMKPEQFWSEVGKLAAREKMDRILAYTYLMIRKFSQRDQPITRDVFVAQGGSIEYYPGVASWFDRINAFGAGRGVEIEHYVISSGIQEIIEGSEIADRFTAVFACEFHYDANGAADWPKSVVNYTTKTQHLFRINKGVLDISKDRELNQYTPEDERRIPFRNMIYIGDGLTDVPCMKLVKVNGGRSIAVYPKGKKGGKDVGRELLRDDRVDFILPADYSAGKELEQTVQDIIEKMAIDDKLIAQHNKQLGL
jgi:2-hydroxy-3-keto-5-methylthiopentenyl-1-phosphate phosphatase